MTKSMHGHVLPQSCDVLVVGAGPAGATAATLLASWGRSVVLLHRDAPRASVAEETMVASAGPLLARLGLLERVRELDFIGTRRHARIWGRGEIELREADDSQRGFKVERETFDRELRRIASERGAVVVDVASTGAPLEAGEASLELAGGERVRISARVVIVATGRTTTETLVDALVTDELPATLAFTARVDDASALRDVSLIEAVREGWLWWLPLRDGGVSLTLFADLDEAKARGRDELWSAALAGALGPMRSCDARPDRGTLASPRLRATKRDVLLAGDAASSLDPLSSQGLEKALSSAENAALCANTMLDGKLARELVLEHQREWERRLYLAHRAQTLGFYRGEQRFAGAPFWSKRHSLARVELARTGELPARMRPQSELARASVLVRRGHALEAIDGVRAPASVAMAFIGPMRAEALLELCASGATLDEALSNAARDPRFLAQTRSSVTLALRELVRAGLLVSANEPSSR